MDKHIMHRWLCCVVCYAIFICMTEAIPAWPGTQIFPQPDGTKVTLRLCGDEHHHFWTTDDGYTVAKDALGYWCYAQQSGDKITASTVVAHDSNQRTETERKALLTTPKLLTEKASVEHSQRTHATVQTQQAAPYDFSTFRGLIVLVEPSDVSFSHESGEAARAFYDTMLNTLNFTGFSDHPELGEFTGSVRDYYYDNSNGTFDPHFDVVGPVKVARSANQFTLRINNANYYYYAQLSFVEALEKLDGQVDFSQYDTDSNGVIDMVFFIVAGYGSHYGNNERYLWPHMGYELSYWLQLDGRTFGRYACSTEMGGLEGQGFIEGIGNICHEFSHILGLPDLYDTDYAYGVTGLSHHPDKWDIMASGAYLNYSRTPPGYSLYERCALGFATPDTLKVDSLLYTLPSLGENNQGYLLPGTMDKEYFLLENRQPTYKWDSYLPGHGMLVARVDSTNADVWIQNKVNCDPNHNYYELVRAGGSLSGSHSSDPFPGSKHVTECTNFMLHSWDGITSNWSLEEIAESDDGVITFRLIGVEEKQWVETFDSLAVSDASPIEQAGDIATWRLLKCRVVADGDDHEVAMVNPSNMTMMTPVQGTIGRVSLKAQNTSNSVARLRLFWSTDGGETWETATTPQGDTYIEVAPNASTTVNWDRFSFTRTQPVQFRVGMVSGSKNAPCLVDDFTIYYSGELGGNVTGDVNGDGMVDIADVNAVINAMLGKADVTAEADVNGDGTVDIADVNAVINIMLGK